MDVRRGLLVLVAIAALTAPFATAAAGIARIGYVSVTSKSFGASSLEAFTQGIKELGYVDGKTFVIEPRWADGNHRLLPALIAELIAAHVDVIVASTGEAATVAKHATSTIPIVMAASADAVPQGLVESLARPGGNVTGLTTLSSELAPKRLQLLKDLLPRLTKVAVLWCPSSPINRIELGHVQAAAATLGLEVQPIGYTDTQSSWQEAAQAMRLSRPDALFLLDCTVLPFQAILEYALDQRTPTMSSSTFFPRAGGLVGYGPDILDMAPGGNLCRQDSQGSQARRFAG
jgi:putative tryptophan/tyrosine transport system substrate-binding protein